MTDGFNRRLEGGTLAVPSRWLGAGLCKALQRQKDDAAALCRVYFEERSVPVSPLGRARNGTVEMGGSDEGALGFGTCVGQGYQGPAAFIADCDSALFEVGEG